MTRATSGRDAAGGLGGEIQQVFRRLLPDVPRAEGVLKGSMPGRFSIGMLRIVNNALILSPVVIRDI